jgi:hypothetical protein
MTSKHDVMVALAAAKPQVFEPTERPDESLRARDLDRILGWPRGTGTGRKSARSRRAVVPRRRMAAAAAGLGAILVAAAMVAAVVTPTFRQARQGPAPTTGIGVAGGRGPVDARQFLLAVAARASRLPAPGGVYWYEVDRTSQISTFGTGGKLGRGPAYTVELSQVTRRWLGSSRWRAVTNREAAFPDRAGPRQLARSGIAAAPARRSTRGETIAAQPVGQRWWRAPPLPGRVPGVDDEPAQAAPR